MRRQRLQNLGLLVGLEGLQNGYGVVALQIAHALDERLDRKFLQNILAGRFADLRERGEIEVRAHQLDQLGPRFVIEQLQQRADIGFVQRAYEVVRARGVAAGDGRLDARHEIRARLASLVAKNLGAGLQFFTIEGHIEIRLPSAGVHNPLQPELKTVKRPDVVQSDLFSLDPRRSRRHARRRRAACLVRPRETGHVAGNRR